jgi:hypothetical protein
VKELNPGQDLLFVADWESLPKLARPGNAAAETAGEEHEKAAVAAPKAAANEPRTEQPTAAANTPPAAGGTKLPIALWLAAAAGVLVCLAFLARAKR